MGDGSYCCNCVNELHKKIISKLPPYKIENISHLEKQMLIDIFNYAQQNEMRCEFQYDINETQLGCKLEKAAERDGYEFNCPNDYEEGEFCGCPHCKYHFTNHYTKYILDFALFKNKVKIDIELDGWNFHKHQEEYDEERNEYLKMCGWIVLRYPTKKILKNKYKIFEDIKECVK